MKSFKQFLKEENETLVYHNTSLPALSSILKDRKLKTNNAQSGVQGPGQNDALSFTRDKNYQHEGDYGGSVSIAVKKSHLETLGKVKSHVYVPLGVHSKNYKKQGEENYFSYEQEELFHPHEKSGLEISKDNIHHLRWQGVNPEDHKFPTDQKYDRYRQYHAEIKKYADSLGIPIHYASRINDSGKIEKH
jgi:hypothetical protein